ncbi:hypothetical protein [Halobacteriovorax sp. DPLXC-1]|uniref:ApeA N-terminal domain 1-containing protein n=1 Tax=Halobacteriovorax sp. DPLXC-1 TaxID=3110771 RepID=UPI002FEF2461
MSKKYNHTKTYEWVGYFYNIGNLEKRFTGRLSYTPDKGITIKATLTTDISSINYNSKSLIGHVEELGKVTLVDVSFNHTPNMKSPIISSDITIYAKLLLIGCHVEESLKIKKCSFKLSSLIEFCSPYGTDYTPYKDSPILSADMKDYSLNLAMTATASFADNFIETHLISSNKDFKKELSEKLNELKQKYKNLELGLKKEIDYIFSLKLKSNKDDIENYITYINEVKSLFAFILMKYVNIIELKFHTEDLTIHVLTSLYINDKSREAMISNDNYPFNNIHIRFISDFQKTLEAWHSLKTDDLNLLHDVSYSRNSLSPNSMQHFLISLAGIEQLMAQKNGTVKNYCDLFLDEYATESLRKVLHDNLPTPKKDEKLGKLVTDMRNCIVHTNKTKSGGNIRYKPFLNQINIGNINEALYACIIIAVSRQLNFNPIMQKKFEDNISSKLYKFSKL